MIAQTIVGGLEVAEVAIILGVLVVPLILALSLDKYLKARRARRIPPPPKGVPRP